MILILEKENIFNYYFIKNNNLMRIPGVEPGPTAWKAAILTVILYVLIY